MEFDGSVIYTMTRRKLLLSNNIKFPEGLHEDIFVIFLIYFYSEKISTIDRVMYLKRNRNHPEC